MNSVRTDIADVEELLRNILQNSEQTLKLLSKTPNILKIDAIAKDLGTSQVCQLNMNIIYSVIAGFDLVVSQDPRQQSRKFKKTKYPGLNFVKHQNF